MRSGKLAASPGPEAGPSVGSHLGEPVRQQRPAGRGWGPSRQPVSTGQGLLGSRWPEPGPARALPAGQLPCCSGVPSCSDVGYGGPGQDGGPFASASVPPLPSTKPGALSVSPPIPALPSHLNFHPRPPIHPVLAPKPLCCPQPSACLKRVPALSPQPDLPPSSHRYPTASPPPPCRVPRGVPTWHAWPQPHLGLSHSALPIFHPVAHSPRHQVTPGSRINHVTPH